MDNDLAQFNKEVTDFGKNVMPNELVKMQKKIVLEALKRLMEKTPVDTGRARGNWQVGIGSAVEGSIQENWPSDAEAISAGISVLVALPPYSTVWISNNLDYIEILEDGGSQQAPQGMLALTVAELKQMFKLRAA